MGAETNSTVQQSAGPLQQLFAGSQGYQQKPIAPINAPQYPAQVQSPEQAAQATVARMLARTPVQAAPVVQKPAPKPKVPYRDIR